MKLTFNIETFVREKITNRARSLLADDFSRHSAPLHEQLDGKRVLVIGGAGSIGSHYIKAALQFDVAAVVVADVDENGLTELVRDLRSAGIYRIPKTFTTYPVSYSDRLFRKIVTAHGPFDVVANFAAHKHVRSEKDIFSIEAMVENNVLRARQLLDLLLDSPPKHFFCVSTDKAANPVNIMGASKKLMEELILAYADRLPIKTARFANVAFSNGSLLLGFLERLAKRQPWSCPLGIRRFFVSPVESGELCLIASVLGESGDIIFPKLDETRDMIPLDRIAIDLLQALEMEPDVCSTEDEAREKMARVIATGRPVTSWPIYFYDSDTSGEKVFEEFHTVNEELDLERFVNLGVVKNAARRPLAEINAISEELRRLFDASWATKQDVVRVIERYLPTFAHIETGRSLDNKM